MDGTPYVATGWIWKRTGKRGANADQTLVAAIELTPELIAAADSDGVAHVYFTVNHDKPPRSRKQPDFIGWVQGKEEDTD